MAASGERLPATIDLPVALVRNSDTEFRKFIVALTAIGARLVKIRTVFGRRISISGVQYTVLIAVARIETENNIGVTEISRYLHLPASQIAREVAACVRRGLLKKSNHASDGRRINLRLTAKGEETLLRLIPFLRIINNTLFKGISRQELLGLKKFVEKFDANTLRALDVIAVGDYTKMKRKSKTTRFEPAGE